MRIPSLYVSDERRSRWVAAAGRGDGSPTLGLRVIPKPPKNPIADTGSRRQKGVETANR